ncbi:MAG: portal protein, partial [Elusimicrobiota bacterium]|nr:portal protein [Elusimicrobiota bacterium]
MLSNGREVNTNNIQFDQKASDNIQQNINKTSGFPDDLSIRTEIPDKELKEINRRFDDKNDTIGGFDFTGFNSFANGFQQNNNSYIEAGDQYQNRVNYYNIFNEMSHTNFINRALQVVCDDACQKNNDGNIINITSEDEDIKNILEDLWHKRLNINKELWSIIYETIKYGDNFYEVIPDSYDTPREIVRIRYLEPSKVNRIEKNGKLIFYTYTDDKAKENTSLQFNTSTEYDKQRDKKEEIVQYRLQPWQIIHFKITDKDFNPYGGSLLKAGVRTFRRLTMLEDAILVYRLARVPERRVFKIGVGNMAPNEANRYVMKVRDNYRTNQVLDSDGNINRKAAALSITQDVFIPIRDGETGTNVDTLPGGQGLNTIDDLKYFRDQILMTLNIPPSYLGNDDNTGGGGARGSLAMQDIKFARFVERIQYYIEEGLTKISYIELFFKKKKREDLSNFRIELTPPSNMKEVIDIEFMNQKMSLIQAMSGTQLFPSKYILKNVMHFSTKEINDIMLFKQLEAQGGQAAGAGGMDMGGGGVPMPLPSSPAEGMPMPPPEGGEAQPLVQDKIINLFGRDILIEKKEDFFKLIKAMDDWKKQQKQAMTEEEEGEF